MLEPEILYILFETDFYTMKQLLYVTSIVLVKN